MKTIFNSFISVFVLWAVIVTAWLVGLYYNLFFAIWWYDIPLHFLGGMWTLLLARYVYRRSGLEIQGGGNKIALFIFFISFVLLVGVLWEFYEFISDRYIFLSGYTHLPGVYEDTLKDLFFDFAGAVTGFLLTAF